MKQFKPVIITAAVCVVLLGIMFAVFKLLPEKQPTPPENINSDSVSNSASIIQKSANSVQEVTFKTDWGEKFTIEYSINDEGDQIATLKGADERFEYDTNEMYTLAGYLGIMAGIEEIPDTDGREEEV